MQKMKISFTAIVKNESAGIARCLESVADLVDEMIVVDTGSTDNTKEIAEKSGAKVYDYQWNESFADARNESIKHATGDWIFWFDGDEYLLEEDRLKLKILFSSLEDENVAYIMNQVTIRDDAPNEEIICTRASLFRNRPDLRWIYRVHEQILPQILKAGGRFVPVDIRIQHIDKLTPKEHIRKSEGYLRLLHTADRECPNDPVIIFHIALTYCYLNRYAESIPYWSRVVQLLAPGDQLGAKAYGLWSGALHALGENEQAIKKCEEGLGLFPQAPELMLQLAEFRAMKGLHAEAKELLNQLISSSLDKNFSRAGINPGIYTFQPLSLLGKIYLEENNIAEAEAHFKKALKYNPSYQPAIAGLSATKGP